MEENLIHWKICFLAQCTDVWLIFVCYTKFTSHWNLLRSKAEKTIKQDKNFMRAYGDGYDVCLANIKKKINTFLTGLITENSVVLT